MAQTSADSLAARLEAWLHDQHWQVDVDGGSDAETWQAHLTPRDGAAPWPIVVICHEQYAQVCFYSLVPVDVPEDRVPAMAEALARVNDGLVTGCAEMSVVYGSPRIRTDIELGTAVLDDGTFGALLERVVANNLELADTYVDALVAVAEGSASAQDAVAAAEQD